MKINYNFFTKNELTMLLNLMKNVSYHRSKVGFNEISNTRTSYEVDISENKEIIQLGKRIIKDVLLLNDNFVIEANLIKYEIGQYSTLHHDEVDCDENGNLYDVYPNDEHIRKFSAIIFLTEEYEGGILSFPKLNLHIQPNIGKLITFSNLTPDFTIDPSVVHESTPVTKGTKIVLVMFFSS